MPLRGGNSTVVPAPQIMTPVLFHGRSRCRSQLAKRPSMSGPICWTPRSVPTSTPT